jgi:hypothetical protein
MKMKILLVTIAALLILGAFLFFNNKSGSKYVYSKSDTTLTEVKYIVDDWNKPVTGPVFRITKDTFSYDNVGHSTDEITIKKQWHRDSMYFIPMVDTLKQNGKVLYDSLKKPLAKINFHYIPRDFVLQDYNKHIK